MPADPPDDDNPIEEILLTGFPNPERIGCPPSEAIEALGEKRIGREDPAWDHVWHCSPCFKQFKTIRDRRLASIARTEQQAQLVRRVLAAAAAFLACIIIGGALFFSTKGGIFRRSAVVSVDLADAGTFRGPAEVDGHVLVTLPRRLAELHIKLPRFSPQGRYVLAILNSKSESTAIALGSANTAGTASQAMLVVTLDLSAAKPGRYFLATRLEQQNQEDAAYYYPVLISGS